MIKRTVFLQVILSFSILQDGLSRSYENFFKSIVMKVILSTFSLWITVVYCTAQDGVGIGTTNVNVSSVLEIESTEKGVLIPRMTTAQRAGINPSTDPADENYGEGLMVFDIDMGAFYYFDGATWVRLIASPVKDSLNLNFKKIANLANGTNTYDAVNRGQLDTKLNTSGGTMSGGINMGTNKITNVTNGTNSSDAVNKGQLDTKLNTSGGNMSGNINMGTNKVTNLANGTGNVDAVNKGQLDDLENSILNEIGILRKSSIHIGDISGDDESFTVSFPSVGTSNYVVLGSVVGLSANVNKDNDVTYVVYDKASTYFRLYFKELNSETQNLRFEYILFSF